MIDGKNFKIIDDQDILKACNFLEDAAIGMLKEQEKDHDEHDQYILDFVNNIFTAIAAAGVGAAIARKQGGLILMKEGATVDDRRAAAEALEKLRPINLVSQTEKGFSPGGIPND